MGIIWSKIRHNPTPKELLEKITKDLDDIYDRRVYTQLQQKRVVGSLIVLSIIIYIISALVFFICYFPSEFLWQIVYSLPLIVFPVIVWLVKIGLQWYFKHSLSQNEDRVTLLLRQRKKLLNDVKEKETYKVAMELLEKYDPEQLNNKPSVSLMTHVSASAVAPRTKLPDMELRRRTSMGSKRLTPQQAIPPNTINSNAFARPSAIIKPGYNAPPGAAITKTALVQPLGPSGIPLPCPILPRQRGGFDRLVEYVLGDGPGNRYALICRQCQSHNGMALAEEFEYIAYRCCYCYYYNPARKQKPLPPRLVLPGGKSFTDQQPKQPDLTLDDSQAEVTKATEDDAETEDKSSEEVTQATAAEEEENQEKALETESVTEIIHDTQEQMVEDVEELTGHSEESILTDVKPSEIVEEEAVVESPVVNDNLSVAEDTSTKSEMTS